MTSRHWKTLILLGGVLLLLALYGISWESARREARNYDYTIQFVQVSPLSISFRQYLTQKLFNRPAIIAHSITISRYKGRARPRNFFSVKLLSI